MANIQIDGARISATKVREYLLHLAVIAAVWIVGLGIVAAGAMVGAALGKDSKSYSRPINNRLADNARESYAAF